MIVLTYHLNFSAAFVSFYEGDYTPQCELQIWEFTKVLECICHERKKCGAPENLLSEDRAEVENKEMVLLQTRERASGGYDKVQLQRVAESPCGVCKREGRLTQSRHGLDGGLLHASGQEGHVHGWKHRARL